jgi:uncharacterized membrane protein YuzA (DUF378 family)
MIMGWFTSALRGFMHHFVFIKLSGEFRCILSEIMLIFIGLYDIWYILEFSECKKQKRLLTDISVSRVAVVTGVPG